MFLDDDYMQTENKMSIAEIAYEKYVLAWTFKNIDRQGMEDTYKRYNEYLIVSDTPLTFDEYTEKYGYAGKRCADFDNFLDNEYKNRVYIENLLSPEEIEAYRHDVKMREMNEVVEREF